jgi:hypothetical protein
MNMNMNMNMKVIESIPAILRKYNFYILSSIFVILVVLTVIFIYWIFLVVVFRFRSRFWYNQPVYHLFDWHYTFYKNQIIKNELPEKNAYVDTMNIETTTSIEETSAKTISSFLRLIQHHYFQNKNKEKKENKYFPEMENILPYFQSHNSKIFLSFYFKEEMNTNENGIIASTKKMIGAITSRPLHVLLLDSSSIQKSFDVYYVDYLCIDKIHRKNKIAEKLIQTIEYSQRHMNEKIQISIFKREDEITGIIPICIYKTYGFSMRSWNIPQPLPHPFSCILCSNKNIHHLYDFIEEMKKNTRKNLFDIFIYPEISNISELIKTGNIFVGMVVCDMEIVSVYFFKKTCTYNEKNREFISLFASIKSDSIKDELFIQGFRVCLEKVLMDTSYISSPKTKNRESKPTNTNTNTPPMVVQRDENSYFSHILVENISSNHIILENLKMKTPVILESNTAFFFYNYINTVYSSERVFILY